MLIEITQRQSELEALCRRFHVVRLEIFGSAVGHEFSDTSDLDFLVEFGSLPKGTYANNYFGLQESLQALFNRPVDLVVASSIRNPYFRKSVEQSKELLYAA